MKVGKIDLSGKVALVTGGGRGIGATISLALAEAGADVIINYNDSQKEAERIRNKIEDMNRRTSVIRADVGDTAQCKALVLQAKEAFDRVDILVSNAGIGQPHRIVDTQTGGPHALPGEFSTLGQGPLPGPGHRGVAGSGNQR